MMFFEALSNPVTVGLISTSIIGFVGYQLKSVPERMLSAFLTLFTTTIEYNSQTVDELIMIAIEDWLSEMKMIGHQYQFHSRFSNDAKPISTDASQSTLSRKMYRGPRLS